MISNTLKAKTADALRELHQSVLDIDDYAEFPAILEIVIRHLFHVDWLGVFTIGITENSYSVVTNPSLPFDWNEKYGEIIAYDEVKIQMQKKLVGKAGIFSQKDFLISEGAVFAFETIKKYTDTSHFLSLRTASIDTMDSGIGFFRVNDKFRYTRSEIEIMEYLSPFLISISQTMMLYTAFDLKRTTLETLCNTQKGLYFTLDSAFNLINISPEAEAFFRKHSPQKSGGVIPEKILQWLRKVAAPIGDVTPGTGPWATYLFLPDMEVTIKAHAIVTEQRKTVLMIWLRPHERKQDFSILVKDGLTSKETETLSYLPLGYTNRQIALAMNIAEITVKKHLKNASKKLEAYGRTETLFKAINKRAFLESILP